MTAVAAAIVLPAAAAPGQPGPQSRRDKAVVIHERRDGFHWQDAGAGAAATVALGAIVFGLRLVLRDHPATRLEGSGK